MRVLMEIKEASPNGAYKTYTKSVVLDGVVSLILGDENSGELPELSIITDKDINGSKLLKIREVLK